MPPSLPGPFLHLLIHFSQEYFSLSCLPVPQVFWRITHPKTAHPPNPCFNLSHQGSQHLLSKLHLQKKKKKKSLICQAYHPMPVPLDTRKRFSFSHLERQVPPVQQDVPGRSQEQFQMIKNGLWNSVQGSRLSTS